MQKSGHMVLKGVNWCTHCIKSGQIDLERSQIGYTM